MVTELNRAVSPYWHPPAIELFRCAVRFGALVALVVSLAGPGIAQQPPTPADARLLAEAFLPEPERLALVESPAQPAPVVAIEQRPLPLREGQTFVVADFNNVVTGSQLRLNNFSGPVDFVSSSADVGSIDLNSETNDSSGGSLRLEWNFAGHESADAFAGVSLTLFGPTEIQVSYDGRPPRQATPIPGYAVDVNNLFGTSMPDLWPGRSVEELRLDVMSQDAETLVLRVELADDTGRVGYTRATVNGGEWQTLSFSLADDAWEAPSGPVDFGRLKKVSFVVEQQIGPSQNAERGELLFDNVALVDRDGDYPDLEAARGKPEYSRAFLEHVRGMSFLYFLDFSSHEPDGGGVARDRGTFPELLNVAGAGFQLTAYSIGAERNYLSRDAAASRVLRLLRLLDDGPQGPERVGVTGYKGFFYHFLGVDGRRKQNFDPATTFEVHESLNTVELSPIDTALAICGALTARQYFDGPGPLETEIRRRADSIYERVDWRFMFDSGTNEFYLGWKPDEPRDNHGSLYGRFAIDDADKLGHYASKVLVSEDGQRHEVAATLDYYTDEAVLLALLAIAAPDPAKRVDASAFFAPLRERAGGSFIRSWPGSLFTYQFASCWLDTQALGADRDPAGKVEPLNYFNNTREAILACRDYATHNPRRHASLARNRFGLSACEGPFAAYFPEAAPPLSLSVEPPEVSQKNGPRGLEVGTLTVYGVGSSIVHTPQEAIDGLWECQRLGLLHPRFGFADAYNLDVADALASGTPDVLRPRGRWSDPAGFAINQGPMLILIDSYLEGQFTPKLFMSHPDVRRALAGLFPDWKQ